MVIIAIVDYFTMMTQHSSVLDETLGAAKLL